MSTRPVANVRPDEVAAAPELRQGARLGRYELLASLGAGGMGQVWLAEQSGELGFRKLVALKVIREEQAANGAVRRMFLDEATIASRIRNANVVEVLDLGEQGSRLFQAMSFVEGASLGALMRALGRGIAPGIAACVVADALRGLHAAHELRDEEGVSMNLVHRDVSPQNILVGLDGVSKISDFGVAKALGRSSEVTKVGRWKGNLRYIAPEQLDGKPATRRGDVFSAGVVLWEALTGQALFPSADRTRKEEPARDPRAIDPRIPREIAAVAMRALALEPEDRLQTALEMAEALDLAAREAACAMAHSDVAALVEGSMKGSLSALRDVIRARRRGEPLPEVCAPDGTVSSAAGGRSSARRPKPGAALPVVMVVLCAALATTAGAVAFASRGTKVPTDARREASPAPVPPPVVTPRDEASGIPRLDSPALVPRAQQNAVTSGTPRRKERQVPSKTAATAAPRAPHDSTADRPSFDNPY